MRLIVLRATASKSTRALVVISPASTTRLSLTSVSAATRERGSWARIASSTASEIWSATLSGWPSDPDSERKRKSLKTEVLVPAFIEAARIPNLVSVPQVSRCADGEIAAAAAARGGNRARLGDLWDIPHLPQAYAREPRAGRLRPWGRNARRNAAHPARSDRFGGPDDHRDPGALVPAARRGRRDGARGSGRGGRLCRARAGQDNPRSYPAHGLLRDHRAVRGAPHADHGVISRPQGRHPRAADARGPQPCQRAPGTGGSRRRARDARGAQARRAARPSGRPGAPGRRGRMGRVLRQAGGHHYARRQARRPPRRSPLPPLPPAARARSRLRHGAAAAAARAPRRKPGAASQPRHRGPGAGMPGAVPVGLQPLQDAARRQANAISRLVLS